MDRLRAMEVFASVAECGSFSKAADALGMSNASITGWVKNLESHLGVVLIQRNSRRLHLTDEGTHFLQRSSEILRDIERAESEIKGDPNSISGAIRVEATVSIGEALIYPLIPAFLEQYPNLSISLSLINAPRNMIEHGTDVAIRVDQVDSAEFWARPIHNAASIACAAPGFIENNALPKNPNDLDPSLCLGVLNRGQYSPRDWRFSRGDEHAKLSPQGRVSCSSTPVLVRAAIEGAGLIHVLDVLVRDQLATGTLVQLFPDWKGEERTIFAVTPRAHDASPKVRAFMRFFGQTYKGRHASTPVRTGGVA
jgi:LysR family transcriptional regulator, regulator for bpeEF and oprC